MASTNVKISEVFSKPTPSVMLIQSAKLSPTVVHRILMIQNQMTTSGTLFSIRREPSLPGAGVYVMRGPLLGHSDRSLTKSVLGAPHVDVRVRVARPRGLTCHLERRPSG